MAAAQFQILCVDDEPNILQSLKRVFRREPYEVHLVASGEEGLKVLESHPIDLVISDNRMPNVTGVEFLAAVKARWPDTVRIILSGYSEVEAITEAINKGHVYKFILKPWEDEALRATVRECLEMVTRARQSKTLRHREQERQQVLAQAQALFQTILDVLPVAVLGVNSTIIVFSNRKAETEFGSGNGSLLVSELGEVFSAAFEAQVKAMQAAQAPAEFDYGHYRVVCVPLSDEQRRDGAVLCFLDRSLWADSPAEAG